MAEPPKQLNKPVGCLECRNSGYMGRACIYELLQMTPGVKDMVVPDVHLEELRKQAFKDGVEALVLFSLPSATVVFNVTVIVG